MLWGRAFIVMVLVSQWLYVIASDGGVDAKFKAVIIHAIIY